MSTIKYIVGDKFKAFADNNNNNVINFSDFLKYVDSDTNHPIVSGEYVIGQGITKEQEEILANRINTHPYVQEPIIHFNADGKSSKQLVHKRNSDNIIISTPVQVDKDLYRSSLIIDENCAEMSDHITGQHIQGMLLIESARQMMLAVSELYYLSCEQKNNMYFILHSVDSEFTGFTFPLATTIEYQVLEYKHKKHDALFSSIIARFYQADELKSSVSIKFTAYPSQIMSTKEQKIAEEILVKENNRLYAVTRNNSDVIGL